MVGKGKGKWKWKKSKSISHTYQDASGSGQDPDAGVIFYDGDDDGVPLYERDDGGVPSYEGDYGGIPSNDNEEEDTYTYPAPLLIHYVAGEFMSKDLKEIEQVSFNIVTGDYSYPVNQFGTVGKYVLSTDQYTCTLLEYLKTKGDFMGLQYNKLVPQNWARSLVRGII